ncbi:hypothetical protein COCVIDRAFT_89616 [Bipolaris victoriae FI3]|uniref:Uncharacterized protein n=1 Tax=Bipolaris victoriae (strain FI3) TaxID=930091 RepID=W7ERM6_BIPV3|nr:hypothetical protein COCVIDRAFT_89616 [Bipolaris victoriae FI3]
MLPYRLRQIIETTPKNSLALISHSDIGRVNNAKSHLETYTEYLWDWWPLAPRIPKLATGEQHLQWKLGRRKLYVRVLQEHAEAVREILKIAADHPLKCHCCTAKPPRASCMVLRSIFRPVLGLLEHNKQRSASSGSSSSKAAMAYTPTSNNTSGASSSNISCGPTAPSPTTQPAPTRIIFGVQGLRKSLEIEQIEICSQMNDQIFFLELKKRYKKHRLMVSRWLSPFQFHHCDFVRFRKISVDRVFFSCEGLPEDIVVANEYEYDPKPPLGKIPLIEPDVFAACLDSCDDGCKWSVLGPWLHDCFQLQPDKERITCIPKKKKEFAVKSKYDAENLVWGIQPGYAVSLVMILIYALVPLLSAFGFWIYWLAHHPGDWQNASVPMVTAVTLETLLLSLLVLSSRSHLRDERR